jgi:hypothetical protein
MGLAENTGVDAAGFGGGGFIWIIVIIILFCCFCGGSF